jgi:hypothetical protein
MKAIGGKLDRVRFISELRNNLSGIMRIYDTGVTVHHSRHHSLRAENPVKSPKKLSSENELQIVTVQIIIKSSAIRH